MQRYLRDVGIRAIVGPPINIGITNDGSQWTRDGTYMYPGSLTVSEDAFVAIYMDLLHSLHDNGLRHAFLVSGHLAPRHLMAVARLAEEANRKLTGLKVVALIDSERAEQLGLKPGASVALIDRGLNFPMLVQLLGRGTEMPASTHADGWEVSLMLHYYPERVRPGYQTQADDPSSRFFEAGRTGDRNRNPNGSGGLPFARSSAGVGKKIADYRTRCIGQAVEQVLATKSESKVK